MANKVPVITIDGPSGSGKGTISQLLAQKLKWHFLDSGAIYRVLALASMKHHIKDDDENSLQILAQHLDVQFHSHIILEGVDVTEEIRSPQCGNVASRVSAYASIRQALLDRQRAFRESPGLVADGRDMGTIVFPDANIKIFLIASVKARAERRYAQLQEKGINVSLGRVLAELAERDRRDTERTVSPLKPSHDAWVLDTTDLSVEEVFERVCQRVNCFF